ncbi:MAG: hypothetical protein NT011_04110 [Kiritimatiellaeota bacterium]|nr:hypothetical protein [Kiritimatiellota bacterium]
MAHISVVEPVGKALGTVRQVLFAPFDLIKWLGLGFTAWLASLTEGFAPNFNLMPNNAFDSPAGHKALAWMHAHLALVISVGTGIAIFILAVTLVIAWVSCRGKFMFLDNVLNNRAEIQVPWRRFSRQGNSLFLFSICFGIAALAVLATLGLLLLFVAWPDIGRHNFGINALSAILLGVIFFMSYMLVLGCLLAFLHDFVVPLMILRSCRVMTAWGLFLDIFKAHVGVFVLYLLFRLVLTLVISTVVMLACCLLCCTVLIPYVGTVMLLPVFVFWRSYSVHFLEQFGGTYRLFGMGPSQYITVQQEPG